MVLTQKFAMRFDGFSIGSNDLTQLTLGADRDSEQLAPLFSEQDEAVTTLIESVIGSAHLIVRLGCADRRRADHPELARYLVGAG